MLALVLWILLSVTACLCSPIAELISSTGNTDAVTIEPRDRNASWWKAKEKHYLRMPINRHVFNGTGRRGHHRKGPHVENPITRRWGWEHLEDLGGIAYIIQRAFVRAIFCSFLGPSDMNSSQSILGHRRSRSKSSSIPARTSYGSIRSANNRQT